MQNLCAFGDIKEKWEARARTHTLTYISQFFEQCQKSHKPSWESAKKEESVEEDEFEKIIISKANGGGVSQAANKKRFNFLK